MKSSISLIYGLFLSLSLVATQASAEDLAGRWSHADRITNLAPATVSTPPEQDRLVKSRMGEGMGFGHSVKGYLGEKDADINEAFLRGIGEFSLKFSLWENEKADLDVELTPYREVLFYNPPYIKDANGNSVINSKNISKYFVVNSWTTKIKPKLSLQNDIKEVEGSSINLGTELGLKLTYIEHVESPRRLPPELLAPTAAERSALSAARMKRDGIFDGIAGAAKFVLDKIESGIKKVSEKLNDEDSASVHFNNSMDSFRLPFSIPFDADFARKMKVDDIISVSFFTGGAPGLSIKLNELIGAKASGYVRFGAYVTAKKIDETHMRVITKKIIRAGLEGSVDVDLPIIPRVSTTIGYVRKDGGKSWSYEQSFEFDISSPEGAEAFTEAMRISPRKALNLIANPPQGIPAVKALDSTYTEIRDRKSRIALNVLFARLNRDRSRETIYTEKTPTGEATEFNYEGHSYVSSFSFLSMIGYSAKVRRTSETFLPTAMDENGEVKGFANKESAESNKELSRLNMTTFYNKNMKQTEFEAIREYIRLSIGKDVLPPSTLTALDEYYKNNEKGKQSIVLITQIDRNAMKQLIDGMTPEQFWGLLERVLLDGTTPQSLTLGKFRRWTNPNDRITMRGSGLSQLQWNENCKVTTVFTKGFTRQMIQPCKWVWILADKIGRAFEAMSPKRDKKGNIKKTPTARERLDILTELEYNTGITPVINALFLKGFQELNDGRSPDIGYYVHLEPAKGIPAFTETTNDHLKDKFLDQKLLLGEVEEISKDESRLKKGELFISKSSYAKDGKIYLSVETPALLTTGQRFSLWLQRFIILQPDTPLAASIAAAPAGSVVDSESSEIRYRYELELPTHITDQLKIKDRYEFQVRIENEVGQALSEFGRFKIDSGKWNLPK